MTTPDRIRKPKPKVVNPLAVADGTGYRRPMQVDPTRYEQSDQVLRAMSTTDEYFVEDKPEDPLVLVVDALLGTLPDDERAVVEMCLMANLSMHEAARMMGYINSSGKEDHKKVKRRLTWAIKKMRETLESPSFSLAIAGHRLPVEMPEVTIKETMTNIIAGLERQLKERDDE